MEAIQPKGENISVEDSPLDIWHILVAESDQDALDEVRQLYSEIENEKCKE